MCQSKKPEICCGYVFLYSMMACCSLLPFGEKPYIILLQLIQVRLDFSPSNLVFSVWKFSLQTMLIEASTVT